MNVELPPLEDDPTDDLDAYRASVFRSPSTLDDKDQADAARQVFPELFGEEEE